MNMIGFITENIYVPTQHRTLNPSRRVLLVPRFPYLKNGGFLACVTRLRVLNTRCAIRRRCKGTLAAIVRIISIKLVGSGTAAFALAPEPLPAVWPKWLR